MTEVTAAIAGAQLEKLDNLTAQRLDLVQSMIEGLEKFEFLKPLRGRPGSDPTYYVLPIRFLKEIAGVSRNEFVQCANQEGALFYQGYVKPLYLQPIYQRKTCFKFGYPFSAPENKDSKPDYTTGSCPVAERLHYHEMMINEHIRPPHTRTDIDDLKAIVQKVSGT